MTSGCLRNPTVSGPSLGPSAGALAAIVLASLVTAACSQENSTRLPDLAALPRRVLTDEEQKKAVEDLKAAQAAHRAEAIKEIEEARVRGGGN